MNHLQVIVCEPGHLLGTEHGGRGGADTLISESGNVGKEGTT